MKNIKLVIVLFFCFFITNQALSQRERSSRAPETFQDNLYLGLGIGNIGIGGFGPSGFLQVGLTPFLGYEFNDMFSAGPLLKFRYSYFWDNGSGFSSVDIGGFGFVRGKFFDRLIVQAEAGFHSLGRTYFRDRISTPAALIGLGWNFGGRGTTQEIMLLYELTGAYLQNGEPPFDYRIAFTTNLGQL